MTDSSRLKDRVVMVTGGGGGIGKGACERIADEGGLVAVLDLRAELAEEVRQESMQKADVPSH